MVYTWLQTRPIRYSITTSSVLRYERITRAGVNLFGTRGFASSLRRLKQALKCVVDFNVVMNGAEHIQLYS